MRYCACMEHDELASRGPHEVIAERVRELRKGRGWSAERLAEEMTAVGVPWSRVVVTKLETGRRPGVSVEELFALAFVLEVAPVHLVVPTAKESERMLYRITPAGPRSFPSFVRAWIRGQTPIGKVDARRYFSEVPESEWPPPPEWTPELIEQQSRAIRRVRGDGEHQ